MTRTTINLDPSVLRELKKRKKEEGKTLGRLVSELLVAALARGEGSGTPEFRWISKPMGVRVDLKDKEAVRRALAE